MIIAKSIVTFVEKPTKQTVYYNKEWKELIGDSHKTGIFSHGFWGIPHIEVMRDFKLI